MIAQMLSRVKKERKAQIEKITREVFPSLKPYRFRLGKAYFFAKIFVPYLTTAYGQPDKSLISCGFTRLDLFTSTCFCLSWCVHPTDAYAQEYENGQLGKTEMWYVLDASKDAKLVYGLKRERTEQQMRDAIAKGTLMKDLQWVPVKKDDLFFIEAGTIHAIGAGALVAEIQENSNLTYRLYDYDRVGKDGKKRELHIDKALDAKKCNADLLLATDPDCDRVGIAVKNKAGEYELLTGNQTGMLLLDYICSQRVKHGKMPADPVMVKTIVTMDMGEQIATHYGLRTIEHHHFCHRLRAYD